MNPVEAKKYDFGQYIVQKFPLVNMGVMSGRRWEQIFQKPSVFLNMKIPIFKPWYL